MAAALVQDVQDSLGRPITSAGEIAQVNMWLDDAELQIRLRLGDVTLLDQEVLAFVEREAAILKIRNPDGKQSEGIDDYNYRRNEDNARGQVVILDEWWLMLSPNTGSGGAFSITAAGDPYVGEAVRSPATTRNPWWDW
jgi:hypothetical protein